MGQVLLIGFVVAIVKNNRAARRDFKQRPGSRGREELFPDPCVCLAYMARISVPQKFALQQIWRYPMRNARIQRSHLSPA